MIRPPPKVEILDFSPEWDYTTGGSKVLVCMKPGVDMEQEKSFECSFGDSLVPVKFVQPGVFKCNTPPGEVGFVPLALLYDGEVISTTQQSFEYRSLVPKKKKRLRTSVKDNQNKNNHLKD